MLLSGLRDFGTSGVGSRAFNFITYIYITLLYIPAPGIPAPGAPAAGPGPGPDLIK